MEQPRLGLGDRLRLLLSASLLPAWREAIVIVQPETILKWHRSAYRLFWRRRSKSRNRARLSADTIDLILHMAERKRFWGAERIRGEGFVGGVRREMLDHVIVLDDEHLGRLMSRSQDYFNETRLHQGIGQRIPGKKVEAVDLKKPIEAKPLLGGLHHDYRRAA
jgi:hypothetical protein